MESDDAKLPDSDPMRSAAHMVRGLVARSHHDFSAARLHFGRALAVHGAHPAFYQGLEVTQFYDTDTACKLGQLGDIARETPTRVDRALQRGRVFGITLLTGSVGVLAWLVPDQPDAAWRRLEEAKRRWDPAKGFRRTDFILMAGEILVAAYTGQTARMLAIAHECAERSRGIVKSSEGRVVMSGLLGMSAAGALLDEGQARLHRAQLRAVLRASIAKLAREPRGWVDTRHVLSAALALELDDPQTAIVELRRAEQALPRGVRPGAYVGAIQLRLGQLLGGDEGKTLVEAGTAALREQGVVNIEAMTSLLVPVCRPRR